MDISLVIPLFNEEQLVEKLISRILEALQPVTKQFEIIFVDDGSTDQTFDLLLRAREQEPRIKILQLSRKFGHQAALTAGLRHAKGNFTGILDGDLQDPPELIPEMYELLASGKYDVVSGRRIITGIKTPVERPNRWFHRIFSKISGIAGMENTGHFSMMNRQALEALLQFKEAVRYLPGLRQQIGFRQGFIDYQRHPRDTGQSKMKKKELLTLSTDAIFSFSKLPIRICLYLGLTGILIFFIAGIYSLIAKLAGFAIPGWSSTVLSIYFLGSIQLTFLGVLGEYIYRIYKESQHRPIYFIRAFYD